MTDHSHHGCIDRHRWESYNQDIPTTALYTAHSHYQAISILNGEAHIWLSNSTLCGIDNWCPTT